MKMHATVKASPELDSALHTGGLCGHPQGLTTLFFTELWERFSYYGMRAILILYMVAAVADGGLGFTTRTAATIYGIYTMSVYLGSIPGGYVADRFLGARLSVLVGGIIIALGHFSLAVPTLPFFYAGLCLIVAGTAFLKPNISAMLGSLYSEDDPRRDAGFSIFYMGINIGAALAPLVCGFLAQSRQFRSVLAAAGMDPHASWHWGFAAAGVGMALGLVQYVAGGRRIAHVGGKPARLAPGGVESREPLTGEEWKRIGAMAVLFFFNMIFWAVYEQGGSSLNLFADRLTRTEIFGWPFPSSWFQTLDPVFVILLAPAFSMLWVRLGKRQPSSPAKFSLGLLLLGLGIAIMVPASLLAAGGRVSIWWLFSVYLLEVCGELCLSPVGLSTVTKLAPQRMVGLTMGVWFLGTALGNYLAGYLSGFFDAHDPTLLARLFGGMAASMFTAAGILALLTPLVRRLMGKVH